MLQNANCHFDSQAHICKALSMLHDSAPLELLACKDKGVPMVGFFDNVEAAAAEAVAWNEKGFNVFTNLNKIDLDEEMRGALNKPLQTAGRELRCANKGDVMEVNWLLVDIDPVRACDNQHVPSTDDEQGCSYEVAKAIQKFICDEMGGPLPLFATSGNGYHLLWHVDLPVNEKIEEIAKKFLLALAKKFNAEGATVDTSTSSLFHLTKVYGTVARKSEATEERPHRYSEILEYPEEVEALPIEILKKVADLAPKGKKEIKKFNKNSSFNSEEDIEKLIKEYFIEVIKGSEIFLTEYSNKEMIYLAGNGTQRRLYALYSKDFSDFLIWGFKSIYSEFVAAPMFAKYIEECAVEARIAGNTMSEYRRIAFENNNIYYNLNNRDNEIIKIHESGVVVLGQDKLSLKDPIFVSSSNMGVQVKPEASDAAALPEILSKYFILASDADLVLLICTIAAWFWPNQPRPILILSGPAGSGKSLASEFIQGIIDPSKNRCNSLPYNTRDLASVLANNYLCVFDNISNIKPEVSDVLCQSIDLGAFSARKLYTDGEVHTNAFRNCLLLNGIGNFANRGDLVDRCVKISLQRISTQQREQLSDLRLKFQKDLPIILGAVFDLVKRTLPLVGTIKIGAAPRLADFYCLGGAISKALWGSEQVFFEAFAQNEETKFAEMIEDDPLSSAVKQFAEKMQTDTLTLAPTDFFKQLKAQVGFDEYLNAKNNFPQSASALGKKIPLIQTALSAVGVDVTQKKTAGRRLIIITRRF